MTSQALRDIFAIAACVWLGLHTDWQFGTIAFIVWNSIPNGEQG